MADVPVDDVVLHVQRLGEGPRTIVFLHGLVMDNLSSWYFTAGTALSRRHEVLLYDLRGHGRSSRPATGYTLERHVADLAGLLAAQGVTRPIDLVGNSFGGLLALAFALRHPAAVRSVALVDGHLGVDAFGPEMAATLSLTGPERDARIAASFASWLGRHQTRKRSRLADAARALVEGTSLVADLRATPPLTPAAIRALGVPVLALYGENSDLRAAAERTLQSCPALSFELMDGCTHSILWEATERVVARLQDWLP